MYRATCNLKRLIMILCALLIFSGCADENVSATVRPPKVVQQPLVQQAATSYTQLTPAEWDEAIRPNLVELNPPVDPQKLEQMKARKSARPVLVISGVDFIAEWATDERALRAQGASDADVASARAYAKEQFHQRHYGGLK